MGIIYLLSLQPIAHIPEPSPSDGLGVARPAIEDAGKNLALAPEESITFELA